jgi:hypothetical protein
MKFYASPEILHAGHLERIFGGFVLLRYQNIVDTKGHVFIRVSRF